MGARLLIILDKAFISSLKHSPKELSVKLTAFMDCIKLFRGVPRNLKRGGAIFDVQFTARKSSEDRKKRCSHVFRRPIYRPKSSVDQKKKGLHVLSLYFSEGGCNF